MTRTTDRHSLAAGPAPAVRPLRNWSGNVTFSATTIRRPTTVAELQEVVARAPRLRVLGSGHSFSRVADTDGDLVSTAQLDLTIEIGDSTVTVPGGTRYGELAVALEARGLALHNLGSLPHISVAGACSTGTHGSGDTNRGLAAAAIAVEYVAADGSLNRVRHGDPDFGGSVVALGALGAITRVTLAVEPSYEVRQDLWLDAPLRTVADDVDGVLGAGYSVSAFTTFGRPDVMDAIWVKSRTSAPAADGRRWGARPAAAAQHPIAGEDPATATQQLGVPGRWHERLPHFRLAFTPSNGDEQQSEYLIPREHGGAALRAIAGLDLAAALQVFELRSIAADDLWLSPCHGRETIGLHFTWINDDALVQAVVRTLEASLAPFDPRPHWGKVFAMEPALVRSHYPQLPAFREIAERVDPNRKFGNAYLDRYVY